MSAFKNKELSAVHDNYVTFCRFVRDPNIKMKDLIHEFEKLLPFIDLWETQA